MMRSILPIMSLLTCSTKSQVPLEHQILYDSALANYDFEWRSYNEDYGNDFGHKESRNGDRTTGIYYTLLPDGRTQTVEYYVDGGSGFVADVRYDDNHLAGSSKAVLSNGLSKDNEKYIFDYSGVRSSNAEIKSGPQAGGYDHGEEIKSEHVKLPNINDDVINYIRKINPFANNRNLMNYYASLVKSTKEGNVANLRNTNTIPESLNQNTRKNNFRKINRNNLHAFRNKERYKNLDSRYKNRTISYAKNSRTKKFQVNDKNPSVNKASKNTFNEPNLSKSKIKSHNNFLNSVRQRNILKNARRSNSNNIISKHDESKAIENKAEVFKNFHRTSASRLYPKSKTINMQLLVKDAKKYKLDDYNDNSDKIESEMNGKKLAEIKEAKLKELLEEHLSHQKVFTQMPEQQLQSGILDSNLLNSRSNLLSSIIKNLKSKQIIENKKRIKATGRGILNQAFPQFQRKQQISQIKNLISLLKSPLLG